MMCPGCQRAADLNKTGEITGYSADHDPAVCRDAKLPPNSGCTCQHDKGVRQRAFEGVDVVPRAQT